MGVKFEINTTCIVVWMVKFHSFLPNKILPFTKQYSWYSSEFSLPPVIYLIHIILILFHSSFLVRLLDILQWAYKHIYIHTHICTLTPTTTHTCTPTHCQTQVRTWSHAGTYTHRYANIHTYTYIHT